MEQHIQVKICGLTNVIDTQCAYEAGADLLGFIFYEPSPRYVSPSTVKEIITTIKKKAVDALNNEERSSMPPKFVGVFVNASIAFVEETIAVCGLDMVQCQGDESPEFIAHFKGRAFKGIAPQSVMEAERLIQQYIAPPASLILLDAYHPTLRGGTGHTIDWDMAANIAQKHPILLAGGLTPDNVHTAIETVKPWGVDVSSGVEASKGIKDHAKVRAFIKNAKGTS